MRNGVRVEEDSNHTTSQIIVDTSANTVYNNTLRVRERENGTYECTCNNNKHKYYPTNPLSGVIRRVRGMLIQLYRVCTKNSIHR